MILANKIDMDDSIKVTEAEVQQFSNSIGAPYLMTSALNDTGIDLAFDKMIDNIELKKSGFQGGSVLTQSKAKKPSGEGGGCKC